MSKIIKLNYNFNVNNKEFKIFENGDKLFDILQEAHCSIKHFIKFMLEMKNKEHNTIILYTTLDYDYLIEVYPAIIGSECITDGYLHVNKIYRTTDLDSGYEVFYSEREFSCRYRIEEGDKELVVCNDDKYATCNTFNIDCIQFKTIAKLLDIKLNIEYEKIYDKILKFIKEDKERDEYEKIYCNNTIEDNEEISYILYIEAKSLGYSLYIDVSSNNRKSNTIKKLVDFYLVEQDK